MNNDILQALYDVLGQVLNGGNGNGLGFCQIPSGNGNIKYLFPNYDAASAGAPPPYLFFLENNQKIPVPAPALKAKLSFLNLIDTTTGGVEKQKLEAWFDAGGINYVLWLGWIDQQGKLNNLTESFLKNINTLSPEELNQPITISISRLVDKPNYDPSKGQSMYAAKVLLADVWKADGSGVYAESGALDANSASQIILKVNGYLTGQAILTPRQPKPKQQQQYNQNQVAPSPQPSQQPYYQQQPVNQAPPQPQQYNQAPQQQPYYLPQQQYQPAPPPQYNQTPPQSQQQPYYQQPLQPQQPVTVTNNGGGKINF